MLHVFKLALIAISITLFTSCQDETECRPVRIFHMGSPIIDPSDPNYYLLECYPEGCDCDTTLDIVQYDMMYPGPL